MELIKEINDDYNYSVDLIKDNKNEKTALFINYDDALQYYTNLVTSYLLNSDLDVEIKLVKLEDCTMIKQFRTKYDC